MPKWYVRYVEYVWNHIKFGIYEVYLIWLYFLVFSSLFILFFVWNLNIETIFCSVEQRYVQNILLKN